jgi:lipopolysaccharide/colanic/teichoic acid biosynthesis glycosyltransferase
MIFYRSKRVGLGGRHFDLLKFRTMNAHGGTPTASMDDPRLTRVGKWLRRFKLDELPTLWNLLKGDIAIVGCRPDVPSEIESLDEETRRCVLSRKPGLISPATLWNIDEDKFLADFPDPHQAYLTYIKPIKYRLNVWYVMKRSFLLDCKVIAATAFKLLRLPITIKVFPEHLIKR